MRSRERKIIALVLAAVLVVFPFSMRIASAVETRALNDLRYTYGDAGLMIYYTPFDGGRMVYEPLMFYESGNTTLSYKTGLFNPSKPNVYSFMANRSAFEAYFQYAQADQNGFYLVACPIQAMYMDVNPIDFPQYPAYIYTSGDLLNAFPANRVGQVFEPGFFGFDSISTIADMFEQWGFWSGRGSAAFEVNTNPNFIFITLSNFGYTVTQQQLMNYTPTDVPAPSSDFAQDLNELISDDNDGGFIRSVLSWIYDKFPFIIPLMLGLLAAGLIVMLV